MQSYNDSGKAVRRVRGPRITGSPTWTAPEGTGPA